MQYSSSNHTMPSGQQIRTLLVVLFAGVTAALLLSGVLLYYYSPSGRYLVKEALLEPNLLTTLSYNDTNNKTGGMSRFVYDGLIFTYYDHKVRKQDAMINPELYERFYYIINKDKSILDLPDEAIVAFNKGNPVSLSIIVRTESHAAWQSEIKVFQKLEISPSDYYRIELHEETSKNKLVYFYRPGIYQETLHLFKITNK